MGLEAYSCFEGRAFGVMSFNYDVFGFAAAAYLTEGHALKQSAAHYREMPKGAYSDGRKITFAETAQQIGHRAALVFLRQKEL